MRKHDYKKLKVWQKSIELAKTTYQLIRFLPSEERFCLSDQMRRAVVSIPSNIAEGYGRLSSKEISHFLSISRGSAYELETQILIGIELEYFTTETASACLNMIDEISRMLSTLLDKERPQRG